jgi:S-DNA-T family DNA segregation ATPase FtsK/SpoIIIE
LIPLIKDPFVKKLLGPYEQYGPAFQEEIVKLSLKMSSLDFIANFIKAEEGPIVRTYYFEPSMSSNLSKILAREEDLALALAVDSIMVSRELGAITIAVPRKDRQIVKYDQCLYNAFSSDAVRSMALPVLLGVDPRGNSIDMDLADQPHLLIAGTTGSGKSVFTSQLICSLAVRHSPKELEFILVDTKQMDLVLFERLAHVKGVVRDIHILRVMLEELIAEVRLRTSTMSGVARNIKEWNERQRVRGNSELMKYVVLIIDEFADVIGSDREWLATLPKKERPNAIEDLLQRLAQISRAAGIHIVLATQRPSVKTLTGDAKANFPSRIAFKLPSQQDSRVILDENGAEKLLGRGDYLYRLNGTSSVKRAHAAFVEMSDINNILNQHEMIREQFQLA